jgi:HD-GYP domain-containing protein (c-di-GMP phosphodiesterase class II)
MDQHRINMSDIVIGEALAWDVYDDSGHLLLSRGHVVADAHQVQTLVERGLFVDAKSMGNKGQKTQQSPPPVKIQERPSALRLINLANKRLERLLYNLSNEADAQEKILEVGKALVYATKINSDVALASILLNQEAGNYPVRHCIDTALLSLIIATSMKKPPDEILIITAAALTMNIGMLRQQTAMQNSAEPLSESDKKVIHDHPQEGVNLLQSVGINHTEWLSYVLQHHENEDGSGYPLGKAGQDIQECAKIISVADRYCACVSKRSYRKSLLPNSALRDILLSQKKNIDPTLTTCFIRELGIYPAGSFVKLENGEVGVVTGKGHTTTAPIVHALIGPRGAPLSFPIKRDTSKQLFSIREVLQDDQAVLRFSMQQLWGEEASL